MGRWRRVVVTPLARSRWANARWLVLAPHADDETLGTGALIADAAARGRLAGTAFLTDGSGSESCPTRADRTRLVRRRRVEAGRALRILAGPRCRPPRFLDWPDAHPHAAGSAAFARSAAALAAMVRRLRIDAIATTAADEPHCDHAACHALAVEVARTARRRVSVFDYVVWGDRPRSAHTFRTRPIAPGRRTAALRVHASQLFGRGFRLPRAKQRMGATDLLYLANSHV